MRVFLVLTGLFAAAHITQADPPPAAPGSLNIKVAIKGVTEKKEELKSGKEKVTYTFELATLKGDKLSDVTYEKGKSWSFIMKDAQQKKTTVTQSAERLAAAFNKAPKNKPPTVWVLAKDTQNGKAAGYEILMIYHEDWTKRWEK